MWRLAWVWCLGVSAGSPAGEARLTFEEALHRARTRSAPTIAARGELAAAEALLPRAERRFPDNPVLDVGAGSRHGDGESWTDASFELAQGFEGRKGRAARRAEGRASVERARAELAQAELDAARAAGIAFWRARSARERLGLLESGRGLADQLLTAADRLYEEGELAALDWNRAKTTAATARAAEQSARGAYRRALADLAATVGEELGGAPGTAFEPIGDLAAASVASEQRPPDLEKRPDLKNLAARLLAAEAGALAAEALSRPGFSLRSGYEREEGADVVSAGIAVALPVHERGREAAAASTAAIAALRSALATARSGALAEIAGKEQTLVAEQAAVEELAAVLPLVTDSEDLAGKSFAAGEIGLSELLLIRRETLEARLAYLDRLTDAAVAHVELLAARGELP